MGGLPLWIARFGFVTVDSGRNACTYDDWVRSGNETGPTAAGRRCNTVS